MRSFNTRIWWAECLRGGRLAYYAVAAEHLTEAIALAERDEVVGVQTWGCLPAATCCDASVMLLDIGEDDVHPGDVVRITRGGQRGDYIVESPRHKRSRAVELMQRAYGRKIVGHHNIPIALEV